MSVWVDGSMAEDEKRCDGQIRFVWQTCCIAAAVFLLLTICIPVSAQDGVAIGAGPGSKTGSGGDFAGHVNGSPQENVTTQNDAAIPKQVTSREQVTTRVGECGTDEACNATHLRAMIAQRNQVSQAGEDGVISPVNITGRGVYAFRAAVQLTGVSSPDLVRLAEEINGSVANAVQNEEQIRSRNAFMTFLFGGDHASADAIMEHVVQNRVRLNEMNRLIDGCGCDMETAAILREQVQAMEQEQIRFEDVASAENSKQGIFGIFG